MLSDESKRKQYDTYGMAGESFGGQGPFGAARGAGPSAAGNGSEFLLLLLLAMKFTILKFLFLWLTLVHLLCSDFRGGFQEFHGTIDPEELFRRMFGQGFNMSDFGEAFGNAFSSAPEVFTQIFRV